ncbi:MAG: aminoglycoside phosphotransferase family protein [Kiritimatiellae bacterium]|nr:aminoglycoside phosphotransferase family protein [Kiritimatiellia bacterium]
MKRVEFDFARLRAVVRQFPLLGDVVAAERYGSGHINDTYKVAMNLAGTPLNYLLQRINHSIFKNPAQLMENILRVTEHQWTKIADPDDLDASRRCLTVLMSNEGLPYVRDEDGNWWRGYLFIEKARTWDQIDDNSFAYEAARAFAVFQNQLADLPLPRLHETIPDFHHTPKRIETLDRAIAEDAHGRAAEVQAEIEFVNQRREECGRLIRRFEAGEIPERITHNDTKINNVMLDDASGKGVCVIDLDTVMPGLALYDFGDMVRSAAAASAEDEQDLSLAGTRIDVFEALARGYLSEAGFLNEAELDELVFSGRVITMTIGIRFLTDYLCGDVYFRTHRAGQNLDRCRVQFQMVRSMEQQSDAMEAVVAAVRKGHRAP